MQETNTLRIAQIVPATSAEGPGSRFAIWFQGCPMRCVECCNPEMLSFDGGEEVTVDALVQQVLVAQQEQKIEGITLLGGEPFAHAAGAVELCERVREVGLSVMIFSGHELRELHELDAPDVSRLLYAADLLVDGRYDRSLPDSSRRWIGSTNQQIHFLTDRYGPNDAYWSEPDTMEIRLADSEVIINGFPAAHAKSVWKRIPKS